MRPPNINPYGAFKNDTDWKLFLLKFTRHNVEEVDVIFSFHYTFFHTVNKFQI